MQCPICKDVELTMADRQGIEIDYCPRCRGIWLDRGELDKIIERSEVVTAQRTATPPPAALPRDAGRYDDDDHRDRRYDDGRYGHKRKKSILGELFDF